jgi:undecaprenyl-diphosphatase
MDYWQILILAIIQGAAELLPVSSSAHVIVAAKLMRADTSAPEFVFLLVMLHTGTMLAVICYFWSRWKRLLSTSAAGRLGGAGWLRLVLLVVIATGCTGVVGLALKWIIERATQAPIEALFKNLWLIAGSLLTVGIFIILAGRRSTQKEVSTISAWSAVWMGIIQGLCLPFRGFSRSGATISMALCRGIARPLAEDFSFALAVVLTPPVLAYSVYHHLRKAEWPSDTGLAELLLPGLVGMGFSFLAGLLALRLLSSVLEMGRWHYFGYYCIAASAGVLAVALAGV